MAEPMTTQPMTTQPMTIYEALRESHEVQRALCTRLVRTGAGNAAGRLDCLRELKLELAAHAAAEERFLYAPILMADAGLDIALSKITTEGEKVADVFYVSAGGEKLVEPDALAAVARAITDALGGLD